MRVNLLKKITLVVFLTLVLNTFIVAAQSTDEPAAPSATQDITATAEQTIAELNASHLWGNAPIVTEVTPIDTFYAAEAYHQEYFKNHPDQGYCRVIIAPKVAKFRKHYLEQLKA